MILSILSSGCAFISLRAPRSAEHTHLAGGNGDPFVPCGVEPGKAEGILTIDVNVLAVREPPPTFVVSSAVSIGDISVAIDSRKFHMVLIFESITSISLKSADFQNVACIRAADVEVLILSIPETTVDVGHINLHGRTVIRRHQVHRF